MPRRPLILATGPDDPARHAPVARRDFLTRVAAAIGVGMLAFSGRDEAKAATNALDPFIGELMLFAGNFAPNGWALCWGQLLPISSNTALFSILGTTYGGNGQTTFGLPDLRGRVPIGAGQGPGLPSFSLGELAGEAAHTLNQNELPPHSHGIASTNANGTLVNPSGAFLARDPSGSPAYGATSSGSMNPGMVLPAGAGVPHNNMPPYLALNWCIALQGVFPPRP